MLHIQVVLYNSQKFLDKFIKGFDVVFRRGEKFIIHFLENSSEETHKFIKDQNPSFPYTYDNENQNFGFGKGHNFLFNKYNSDYGNYFLILNPDVLPFFNFLSELNTFLKSKTEWGIIELAQFPQEHPKDFDEELKTEWAHGAASVFQTNEYKKLHGFDENIFLYCEDVDISWRIREIGKNIYFCPKSRIAHITQNLDHGKDNTIERVYSFAGGLYLRYKYFNEEEVEKYKKQIQGADKDYEKALEIYAGMKEKLTTEELEKYRKFTTPKLYSDTNYAKHLW